MARSPSDQEYQVKEGEVISQLLKFLKPKLRRELSAKMACYYESKVLLTELQVYIKLIWYKAVCNLRQNRWWETYVHKLLFVRNRCKRARTERVERERSCAMSNLFTYHSVSHWKRLTVKCWVPNFRFALFVSEQNLAQYKTRFAHLNLFFLRFPIKHYMLDSNKVPRATLSFQIWSDLLAVAKENQGFDLYREHLIEELTSRARRVRFKWKAHE